MAEHALINASRRVDTNFSVMKVFSPVHILPAVSSCLFRDLDFLLYMLSEYVVAARHGGQEQTTRRVCTLARKRVVLGTSRGRRISPPSPLSPLLLTLT